MLGDIISSVVGGLASSVLGGGRKQAPATPRFSRQQAPFNMRVPNTIDTRTSMETLPEESAQVGTLQALINKHEAIMASFDVDNKD